MEVFREIDEGGFETPTVLTFGVFDGLHLGHQLIMRKVVERAKATGLAATAITFDPHPRAVLHPDTAPSLLQTLQQRLDGMEGLGIDQTIVLNFTPRLALVSAEDFLHQVVFGKLDAREVYLGHGFAFGHDREGKFELLRQTAERLGRFAEEVPEVLIRGRRVSSSMIRRLLVAGRVNLARRMLGRPYSIESRVIEGRKLGEAKLHYATANLKPENSVIPANGVYVTFTSIEGVWHRSITNVGHRPTFGEDPDVTVESHILNFDREIYGQKIRVRFLKRLRSETKFESADALRAQIARDYLRAVRYFDRDCIKRTFEFE